MTQFSKDLQDIIEAVYDAGKAVGNDPIVGDSNRATTVFLTLHTIQTYIKNPAEVEDEHDYTELRKNVAIHMGKDVNDPAVVAVMETVITEIAYS